MTYGLTNSGFKAKRLADIKDEIETDLRNKFGNGLNFSAATFLGQLIGIIADREALVWELAEGVYNSQYPLTSEGVTLDNVVSITGLTRQNGVKSKVDAFLVGTVGTAILTGSVFSVEGVSSSRFVLSSEVVIATSKNEVQKLNFSDVPTSGTFKLKHGTEITDAISYDGISQSIRDALLGLPSLSSVLVAGDFLDGFDIVLSGTTLLPLEIVESSLNVTGEILTPGYIKATLNAETIGATEAPANSLRVIENPISGLDYVFNPLDAELGRAIETDAELKARREASLQRAGAGTLGSLVSILADVDNVVAVVGFENTSMLVNSGRPPKSFEIVVQGGTEADLAKAIWENKPAGIYPFGTVVENIVDSQGFNQTVRFSRPTEKSIYLELDITVDASFPANGVDQIKEAILNYGNSLGIGKKVIVYPKLVASLNSIAGLLDLVVRIGTSANPTQDNNIEVAAYEISKWDSSRIEVTTL